MLTAHRYHCVLTLQLTMTLLLFHSQPARSSGVFELEFIRIEQLDIENRASSQNSQLGGPVSPPSANKRQLEQQQDPSKLVRIFVCLKEAFTNQLDGQCTYGNASINLQRDSIMQATPIKPKAINQIQGSLLTNTVRIPFTFRWTKSFTIILTGEHLPSTINRTGSLSRQDSSYGAPVDRHVLTENEVLPNLESNANKPWSSRFSRSLHSSLAYRFRVYCSLNYYGDGCATFCRPRDDQFGHYNCSSTGQKLCHDGWYGPDCDQARCRQGCDPKHGYCDKPDTCNCRHGWTGPRCDECITYPGCQHGYCLSPWQCTCQRNWGGVLCDQDLNYCGSHNPCKNNATCQNVEPGKYKCTCSTGFEGTNCEKPTTDNALKPALSTSDLAMLRNDCTVNLCVNGGTCYALEHDLSKALQDTDSASFGSSLYRCQCPSGWVGDFCQWADSSSSFSNDSSQRTQDHEGNQPKPTLPISTSALDELTSGEVSTYDYAALDPDPILNSIIEVRQEHRKLPVARHLDMKHLISGVMIASVVGVFLALLLLAWCCLIAVERNRLPFIQMNIISSRPVTPDGQRGANRVVGTLRRMHERIRDSLRLSRPGSRSMSGSIKPDTKLSIENVLRPPPSYEESKTYDKFKYPTYEPPDPIEVKKPPMVKVRGVLEQKMAASRATSEVSITGNPHNVVRSDYVSGSVSRAQLECPRHGHLYREHMASSHKATTADQDYHWISTDERIESLPTNQSHHAYYYESERDF